MIGQTLGHYRIVEKIGAGGMGEVYRAHDEQLDRDVALKVLPAGTLAEEAARKQFRKEALALGKLNHPNIETVHDFGSQDGTDFLVMELISGSLLSEKLGEGPLPENEVLKLGVQLAEGLTAAHEQGVIHRDLKPKNLIITSDGRLKILDFGLAKLVHPEVGTDVTQSIMTSTGTISGTVPYMSPEQLRNEAVDARSDIYAAGAVLYEMATGRRPFPQTHGPTLMGAILHESPPLPRALNPHVSSGLESVILNALKKERSQRYQSVRELRVALEGLSFSAVVAPVPRAGLTAAARLSRRWKITISAAMSVLLGLSIGAWLFYAHKANALSATDTIVLADFTNHTGDAIFDDTLKQGLSVGLAQSPFFNILSDQKVRDTLKLMGRSSGDRLTPDVARDVCQRVGSKAYLSGSIASLGSQYVLGLKAVNCQTGDSLAQEQATADTKEHVLKALNDAATKLREKVGESLSSIQKFDMPIEQATTPSLEALRAYSLGWKAVVEKVDLAAAVPLFQRAIRLDPNFAMAYDSLGVNYVNLGETSLAAENARKAYELRERVSEREKLNIECDYQFLVRGDLEKARQAYELWAQTYPRDFLPPAWLGGIYTQLGEYDKALAESREAHRLDPAFLVGYANLTFCYVVLNRLREAQATAEEAQAKNLDSPSPHILLYEIAFLQEDMAGMARQVAWGAGKPGVEDVFLNLDADTAAYSGRLGKARELSRRAVASAERAEEKETAASYEADAAVREALFGNAAEARKWVAAALTVSTGRDVQFGTALALALARDAVRAESLADDLAKRFPEGTVVQFNYLPTLRAQLALSSNDASKAVKTLQAAAPYELGNSGFFALYPVYVRGEARLAAHQGGEAAGEFQKILDQRGVVQNEPIGALAHLGLARAYALRGDTAKARTAYQDFLALWKDADPNIPILQQAKVEYAQLK